MLILFSTTMSNGVVVVPSSICLRRCSPQFFPAFLRRTGEIEPRFLKENVLNSIGFKPRKALQNRCLTPAAPMANA